MIPLNEAILFVMAAMALAMVPGPDNIFVMMLSALNGFKAGIAVVAGLCSGLVVHTMAAAMGISAIFQTSPVAFNVVKILGALYLLYLAWQSWNAGKSDTSSGVQAPDSLKSLYIRGLVMNITNPKVTIFFLAFLPQFANPAMGSVTAQMIQLGLLFIASAMLVFTAIAWFAGGLGDWLKHSPKAQTVMNRCASVVFVGLALKLVVSER